VSRNANKPSPECAEAVPVEIAAQALGISARQLEADIAAGAPVARRGRKGRGCCTLVEVGRIRAWRARRADPAVADGAEQLKAFADGISELVASAIDETFREVSGPHKRALAGALAGAWLRVTIALREPIAGISPEPSCVPEKITALLRIFEDSGSVLSGNKPRGL
jgi:hypothetical protein